jgi:ABC-type transport system involved in multi-copper enzyme maturation permease subunit
MNNYIKGLTDNRILPRLRIKPKIKFILKQFNDIYHEIDDYNNNYWSIILFWIYTLFIFLFALLLNSIIFSDTLLVIRFILYYIFFIITISIISLMEPSSLLFREANNTNKLMNKMYCNFSKNHCLFNELLKVCLN